MKKIILAFLMIAVVSGSIFFTACNGCKEIGPNINLSPGSVAAYVDSSYTLTVSQIVALTTDAHNVLIEEFTGQACSNCPAAHAILDGIASKYPGRINAIGMYPPGIPQAYPPTGSANDFRDSNVYFISKYVTGNQIAALPSAFIDRTPSGGQMEIDGSNAWSGIVSSQLTLTDSVDLSVNSSYNSTTMMATITALITYTQPVTTKQNLSVVIVEDTIVDIQEYPQGLPPYPSGYDSNYVFTNVFRYMVSSIPAGDPILDTVTLKAKGSVLKRTYNYKLKSLSPAVNAAHCRVIAYINSTNGTDYHILQSAQTKFAP